MTLYIALGMIVALVGADQLIKFLAATYLAPKGSVPIIQDMLHLTYLENDGAAFGLFGGMQWILIVVTALLLALLVFLIVTKRIHTPFLVYTVSLIIAGGLGNLIDRVFRHYVIDYIDVQLIGFAVFNLADCCVVIGTILALIYVLFVQPKKEERLLDQIEEDVIEGELEQEQLEEQAAEESAPETEASNTPEAPAEGSHDA